LPMCSEFRIAGNVPMQCQQYPMEYHYSQTCSQRVQSGGFMGTICPEAPVDPRKYRDKTLSQQKTQEMPPNFYRIGAPCLDQGVLLWDDRLRRHPRFLCYHANSRI